MCDSFVSVSVQVVFIPFTSLLGVEPITSPIKINQAKVGWIYGITLITNSRSIDLWAATESDALKWLDSLERAVSLSGSSSSSPNPVSTVGPHRVLTHSASLGGGRHFTSQSSLGGSSVMDNQMDHDFASLRNTRNLPILNHAAQPPINFANYENDTNKTNVSDNKSMTLSPRASALMLSMNSGTIGVNAGEPLQSARGTRQNLQKSTWGVPSFPEEQPGEEGPSYAETASNIGWWVNCWNGTAAEVAPMAGSGNYYK